MENQNIILTIVVVVFLYVAWSINSNMNSNLKLMTTQISQSQNEQAVDKQTPSNPTNEPVQEIRKEVENNRSQHMQIEVDASDTASAYDVYDNEMQQNAHYETQARSSPNNINDPYEHNPYELYMGKQQYMDDRPHKAPLPNFPQTNPSGNGKGDVLFDREIQNINNIPGGIMENLNGPNELEPEGVLTSLAGEYDGTMSDGIIPADNILNERRAEPNLHNSRISAQVNHSNGRCGCSSCTTPGRTSEQCVSKMMQQTGSYEHSLRSCNLPGSTSDRCHSGRYVG